jgi:hypothetical protein
MVYLSQTPFGDFRGLVASKYGKILRSDCTVNTIRNTVVLCPYCCSNDANSNDHIFPAFLGGTATVPVCGDCNNKFGHTFEAAASRHFKEWMFFFRRSGMPPPKPMVWKNKALDSTGIRYDINQNMKATTTKPIIERDDHGQVKGVHWDPERLDPIVRSLQKDGHEMRVASTERITMDIRELRFTHPIDDDIKRLCMKMSVATAQRIGVLTKLDYRATKYLLEGVTLGLCPVRIAVDEYATLDGMRPAVGHLIYVRANASERRAYAVVQLFTTLQFYCELACDWQGEEYAALATHDPVSHDELFRAVPALDYPLPEQRVPKDIYERWFARRLERLRLELVWLYGDQAPLSFKFNLQLSS